MESQLYSVEKVKDLINEGRVLALAGDERLLSQLPQGAWIGGTIPYFMDVDKGKFSQDMIYVNELEDAENGVSIITYDENNIDYIVKDAYDNGFTLLIIPPFQKIHYDFALKAEDMEGLYNNPIVGWVCGMDLNSDDTPYTFNGLTGEKYTDKAIAIHVELPENKFAQIEIFNIFERDENSPEIEFYVDSFEVVNCLIDGKDTNLAEYISEHKLDTKLPLVADYSGASINVSIKEVDVENGMVSFYAPVFQGKKYKFAKPINNYVKSFEVKTLDYNNDAVFSCNCILNYLYGELENKKINKIKGPITFGEIAYQLLNQTLVSLNVDKL